MPRGSNTSRRPYGAHTPFDKRFAVVADSKYVALDNAEINSGIFLDRIKKRKPNLKVEKGYT